MKKRYLSFGVIWEWDDNACKWENLGKAPKEIEEPARGGPFIDWRSWSELLLATFKEYRESPGWIYFLDAHDDGDKKYFEMLESHYKSGRLKVKFWAEEENGDKQLA